MYVSYSYLLLHAYYSLGFYLIDEDTEAQRE